MNNEFLPIPNGACEIHEFYHSYMWIEDNIIFGIYKPDLVINHKIAKEIIADRKKVSKGISRPFLIDITELLSVDAPARKYMASADACEFLNAGAIYTPNKLLAFLGNAWILLDKPLVPAKIFANKEAALKWLEPFKHQN